MIDGTTQTGVPGDGPGLPALPLRIVEVFTSPARLFDALAVTPRWLAAMLVVIALGLVVQALIPVELIREAALAGLPRDAPPEQVAAVEQSMGIVGIVRWVGTVLFPPLVILFTAGFVLLVWNVLLGGEGRFAPVLACTSHSFIVWAFGGLVTLPLVFARQDLRMTFSLHLLAPGLDDSTYLFRFLQQLNLFGLWTMVLVGIAVSRLYPKKAAPGPAIAVMVAAYVLMKAVLSIFSPG